VIGCAKREGTQQKGVKMSGVLCKYICDKALRRRVHYIITSYSQPVWAGSRKQKTQRGKKMK